MQMIDVLKRLAELDADNPRVEKVAMTNEQSLATVTNIEGDQINECGPMGMDMGRPSMPASFSINASAESGAEVSSMLRDIMNLAGVKSPMGDIDHDGDHDMKDHEIELGAPHAVELDQGSKSAGDEMGGLISMIDQMNGPEDEGMGMDDVGPESLGPEEGESDSPVADMADEVRDMADEMAGMKDEGVGAGFDSATTTPDEKIKAHDHGNSQTTIGKKQGFAQRQGDNPYTEGIFGFGKKSAPADTGNYADGSSIKTPDASEWKQQYQQAVMAVKNAKTQQEYEAASERAGKIKDLLASKGIKVGPVLGQGMAEDVQAVATRLLKDYQAFVNETKNKK